MEEYFRTGGFIMVPLAVVSLTMWLLIVDRALFFRRLHSKNMDTHTPGEHIRTTACPTRNNTAEPFSLRYPFSVARIMNVSGPLHSR
jgi:biopolymer transport protein ExbB